MSKQDSNKIIDTGYSYCFKENGEDVEVSYCDFRAEEIKKRYVVLQTNTKVV
jgi:hypothetical protein